MIKWTLISNAGHGTNLWKRPDTTRQSGTCDVVDCILLHSLTASDNEVVRLRDIKPGFPSQVMHTTALIRASAASCVRKSNK